MNLKQTWWYIELGSKEKHQERRKGKTYDVVRSKLARAHERLRSPSSR